MLSKFSVSIEPTVLKWARESIGLSRDEVAKRVKGVTTASIEEWEKENGKVNFAFAQIGKLSTIYKRPLSAFLLSAPPKEAPFPKDFRTFPSGEKKPLHPKTYLVVRKARRFQYSMAELTNELGEPTEKFPIKANLTVDPEVLAERTRGQLGVKNFPLFVSLTTEAVLNEWIEILENNGIVVSQISITKNKEIRGFSLVSEDVPLVVLKRTDAPVAKIFTLFHELAHIILREDGICDLEESNILHEKFCNHFAGAFLVPKNELLNYPMVKANKQRREWPDSFLAQIAHDFKVSKEVILRRLWILGLTTREYYLSKHKEWETKYKEPLRKGKRNEIKICIQERGKRYISMVFDAYECRKIDRIALADYLGVTSDKISKIKDAM